MRTTSNGGRRSCELSGANRSCHECRISSSGEGGTKRVGEEAALVRRGFAGVDGDQLCERDFVVGASEIAVKQEAAGGGHANRFGNTARGSAMWWTMLLLMTTGTTLRTRPSAHGKRLASARSRSMRS